MFNIMSNFDWQWKVNLFWKWKLVFIVAMSAICYTCPLLYIAAEQYIGPIPIKLERAAIVSMCTKFYQESSKTERLGRQTDGRRDRIWLRIYILSCIGCGFQGALQTPVQNNQLIYQFFNQFLTLFTNIER